MKEGFPPLPEHLRHLPIDARGYPVPWFVAWIDGVPDFRVADGRKFALALRENRCWICGAVLGAHKVFAIGPMCAVNRATAEPPNHLACAEYAVKACPFLVDPKRRRRENDMPDGTRCAGEPIRRNPGVTLLWSTRKYKPFRAGAGIMFELGEPTHVSWWSRGRPATREEVDESIESGMPLLRDAAARDGAVAIAQLEAAYRAAQKYLPIGEEA